MVSVSLTAEQWLAIVAALTIAGHSEKAQPIMDQLKITRIK